MSRPVLAALIVATLPLSGCFILFHDEAGSGGAGGASSTSSTDQTSHDATGSETSSTGGLDRCITEGGSCVADIPQGWSGPVIKSSAGCTAPTVPVFTGGGTVKTLPACNCVPSAPVCKGPVATPNTQLGCSGVFGAPVTLSDGTCVPLSGAMLASVSLDPAPPPDLSVTCVADPTQSPPQIAYSDAFSLCGFTGDQACDSSSVCAPPLATCIWTTTPGQACPPTYPKDLTGGAVTAKNPVCPCSGLASSNDCAGSITESSDAACAQKAVTFTDGTCNLSQLTSATVYLQYKTFIPPACTAATLTATEQTIAVCCQ